MKVSRLVKRRFDEGKKGCISISVKFSPSLAVGTTPPQHIHPAANPTSPPGERLDSLQCSHGATTGATGLDRAFA